MQAQTAQAPRRAWVAVPALGVLALALALRLPWLGELPSPAGDEANWFDLARRLALGQPASLPLEASFVTTLFARLASVPVRLLGPSYGAARLVPALGVSLCACLAFAELWRRRHRRAALLVGLGVALHPWPLFWSRTVAVPYALCLCIAILGPLAWLAALGLDPAARRSRRRTLALVLAAQGLVLGLHFSPLGAIPIVACGLVTLGRRHRWLLTTPGPWLALLGLLAHALPLLQAALQVAHAVSGPAPHAPLAERLGHYALVLLDGNSGQATVRHVAAASGPGLWLGRLIVLGALVIAGAQLARARRQAPLAATARAERTGDEALSPSVLGPCALLHLGLAAVRLMAMLGPARSWWQPRIDAERYLCAVLAPALLLGGAALQSVTSSGRAAACLALALAVFFKTPYFSVVYSLAWQGGPDAGLLVERGGGWRGWKVAEVAPAPGEGRAIRGVPQLLLGEAERLADGRAVVLVLDDCFGFESVRPLVGLRPPGAVPLEVAWSRDWRE
jgi:hypothetical protein